MVYKNYTLKPRLENKQFFQHPEAIFHSKKMDSTANREPPHNKILTANCSEKERFSVNWQIKRGETARL